MVMKENNFLLTEIESSIIFIWINILQIRTNMSFGRFFAISKVNRKKSLPEIDSNSVDTKPYL